MVFALADAGLVVFDVADTLLMVVQGLHNIFARLVLGGGGGGGILGLHGEHMCYIEAEFDAVERFIKDELGESVLQVLLDFHVCVLFGGWEKIVCAV